MYDESTSHQEVLALTDSDAWYDVINTWTLENVVTAFLQEDLDEKIYMEQPSCFVDEKENDGVQAEQSVVWLEAVEFGTLN